MIDPQSNHKIWRSLYAQGKADLCYPSETFVRLSHRLLGSERPGRVLDFGFGTGANLVHLGKLGHQLDGLEISTHAIERAGARLQAEGLTANLQLFNPGDIFPFPDASFDAVIAWQVLYYNDWQSLRWGVAQIERVCKSGGLVLAAMAAPGDISQTLAKPLGDGVYESQVPGQEGCIVLIPERADLERFFPQRHLEIGEFSYRFGESVSRHWVVVYRKE